ncbi:MAG: glycosyltransferase family 4 protein [Endomicrobium sp.]|nr:glycosyltransferase family 4 protein [Endomicrobium sp.]
MIKVCYIITKLELGGAQKVALYTAGNLDKSRFCQFMISGSGGALDAQASKQVRLISFPFLVRQISPLKDLKALFAIYKVLKKEKPDIVHTHSSKAGILGRIAAKLAAIKTIIHTIHGYGFNETQPKPVKYFYILLEKFCAHLTDRLIAVSKEDIKKGIFYKIAKEEKFVLIRAGIDIDYYKNYIPDPFFRKSLGISADAKIITTIGPFKPQKNLKDFIEAANITLKTIAQAVFLIVGDGELRKQIESQIASYGLQNKILLLGWRSDIAKILRASDLYVMTSLWEGLPCTIIEAMCCAVPVIANGVDGVKEIISEAVNGYKTQPYHYQDTAAKITELLKNETLLKDMGVNAKNSITEEFDINYALKRHEALYESLIK